MTAISARIRRQALVALACAGVSVFLSMGVCAAGRDGDEPRSRADKPIAHRLQLAQPDAVIQTASLSSLPKDILVIPQLKDLLSEDFLYYYETNEERLGIDGALRRIAYEHHLSLADEILAKIFNMPAEVALWEGYDGRLSQFAMAVGTRGLAKTLELLFSVASNDKQLTKAGRLELNEVVVPRPGAAPVTVELNTDVYRLVYGNSQKLFVAVVKDRLLVFSDEAIAMPGREQRPAWAKLFAALFTGGGNSAVFLPAFQVESSSARHSIVVSADYLSFGYQRFFPSLKAIKFDMTDKGWSTSALASRPRSPRYAGASVLWKAVPNGPSLCFALPVDAATAKPLLAKMVSPRLGARAAQAVEQLESASAVCWFQESKFYTPLVVMKVKSQPWLKEYLRDLFQRNVGGWEAGILTEEQKNKLEERKKGREGIFSFSFGSSEEEPIRPASFTPPFPISEKTGPSGTIWSRVVSSRYGLYDAKGHPLAAKMRSSRYFNVTLAHWKGYVLFSPDDRMVERAIAVLDKRFPPVADTLALGRASQDAMALINPGTLGQLVRQSSLDSLPSSQESIFRTSVSRYLFPNLEKLNLSINFAPQH